MNHHNNDSRRLITWLRLPQLLLAFIVMLSAASPALATDVIPPPVTTATPSGGTFFTAQNVTLSCDDQSGGVCDGTFYCLGSDCTPTTPYTAPIAIPASAGLRFFSRDAFGNKEAVKMQNYNFIGSISGSVTESGSGNPIQGVTVKAYDLMTGTYVGQGSTDSSGNYSVTLLPNGYYQLFFMKTGYVDQWYSGINDSVSYLSTVVTVASPSTISGINAIMAKASSTITGTVTGSDTGVGVPGVSVSACDTVTGGNCNGGTTNGAGVYSISGLPAGSYTVSFLAPYNSVYLSAWNGNQSNISSVIVASAGTTSGINYVLAKGGTITGTVTDGANGAAIPDAGVFAYDAVNGVPAGAVGTNSSGVYTMVGLSGSGSYKLVVSAAGFFSRWYGGTFDKASATTVTVTGPNTASGVNVSLAKGASIAGTVTNTSGTGIFSASVAAFNAAGFEVGGAITDSTGAYKIEGLATDIYKLQFSAIGYFSIWSGGKLDQTSATTFPVTAPDTTVGVNAVLSKTGTITGTVTDKETGAQIQGVGVSAYDVVTGLVATNSNYGVTDSHGAYSITGLASGSYTIKASSPYITPAYADQWYNNQDDIGSANAVQVTAPGTTAGIDFALQKKASITGIVTDSGSGFNVMGISVTAYNAANNDWIGSARTDGSGAYNLPGLQSGDYKLFFQGSGYVSQWFNGKNDQGSATVVSLTPHATVSVNMALAKGGSISGTISDRTVGTGVANVTVYAADSATGAYVGGAQTDSAGGYTITGLASGSYRLRIESTSNLSRWYGGSGDYLCAALVSVTAPNTTTGIDSMIDTGGSISGRIIDATTGLGISGVHFSWIDSSNRGVVSILGSDATGAYTLSGLAPGEYALSFSATDYVGKTISTPVKISGADVITGFDLSLVKGGRISGSITETPLLTMTDTLVDTITGGKGLSGAVIEATDTTTGAPAAMGVSDVDGNYTILGLATGNYSLRFYTTESGYESSKQTFGDISLLNAGNVNNVVVIGPMLVGGAINSLIGVGGSGAFDVNAGAGTGGSGAIITSKTSAKTVASSLHVIDNASTGIDQKPNGGLPVSVIAPDTTSGMSFRVENMGSIAGNMTDGSSGEPVASVSVVAYDGTGAVAGSAVTDNLGHYTVNGLFDGGYRVRFLGNQTSGTGYLNKWYVTAGGSANGSEVSVQAPGTTSGIDAQLTKGGGIAGSISMNSCSGPHTLVIGVYDATGGNLLGQVTVNTDYDSSYAIGGLPAGSYMVTIDSQDGAIVRQWYPNKTNSASAQPVTVSAGATTGGIDFPLVLGGGSIAGKVSAETGCAAVSGPIKLYDWFSGGLVAETAASSVGSYQLTGLPDATYKLLFSGNDVPRWYTTPGATTASPIVVSGGMALTGIDLNQACVPTNPVVSPVSSNVPTLADVLSVLRMAVGLDTVTPQALASYDLAPVVDGVSVPDGKIDISDVLLVLQKLVNSPIVPGQN